MFDDDSMIAFGEVRTTDVSFGTSANYAYELYKEKKQKISELEYECKLLVDKYHSEMCHAHIPPQFRQDIISDMFGKDTDIAYKARNHFLEFVFSKEFINKHRIVFEAPQWLGYERTSVYIILNISDSNYNYSVEIPFPNNITKEKTKTYLMGQVMFRADRILKSKWKDFIKEWEAVQMPTYDWKACFEAIEKDVVQ